ncbi:MAG: sulfotransferase [Desulfobacterales bacterium]|nr:sulfotransferase [Desulfobacterales bacterium]
MTIKLSADQLIAQAIEKTGSDNFGGNSYKQGLEAFVSSLNNDIALTEGPAGYFSGQIIQLLVNRVEITQLINAHPEILDEKIKEPVFVIGLPRSGTTILQTLLALDPSARFLRNFETTGPICPPPELLPSSVDPRPGIFHEAMEGMFSVAPGLKGINGINFMAHGTAECQNLTAHEFVHMGWSAGSSLFSHGNWVGDCNMVQAYKWHKKILQVLQWKLPNERWVLKAPMHLFGVEALIDIYPDAKIVFTHRDPIDAMVSGISMVYHWTNFTAGQADKQAILDWYPKLWAQGLKRALLYRKKLAPDQGLDIFHQEMSADPIKTVEKIYNHFRIPLLEGAKKRMQTWMRDNPRSKFGNHECTLNEFGIEPQQIKEIFDFYYDQYGW